MKRYMIVLKAMNAISLIAIIAHIISLIRPLALVTVSRITVPIRLGSCIIGYYEDFILVVPILITIALLAIESEERIISFLIPIIYAIIPGWFLSNGTGILLCISAFFATLIVLHRTGRFIEVVEGLLYALIALGFGSICYWILHAISPNKFPSLPTRGPAGVITHLYYVVHEIGIIFATLFLYSWLLFPYARGKGENVHNSNHSISKWKKKIMILSIITTAIIGVYPYLPTLNPTFKSISVDVYYYTKWIREIRVHDLGGLIEWALSTSEGSRPFSLLVFYLATKILPFDVEDDLKIMTICLLCLIPISVYVLAREIDEDTAILSMLLASLSPTVLVGLYAGYQSNLFTLIFAYIAQAYLIRALRSGKYRDSLLLSLLLLIVSFSHTWTWQMLIGTLLMNTLIYIIKGKVNSKKAIIMLILALMPSIIADVIRARITVKPTGVSIGYKVLSKSLGMINLINLGKNLRFLNNILVGGYTAEWISYLLAFVGMIIAMPDEIVAWIILPSMVFLVSNHTIQSRLLFNIPVSIPAALAISWLSRRLKIRTSIFVIAIYLTLLANSLMMVANMVFP